jgi:RNA polymerase sigma-70 factor (ECF subfamily)
MLSHDNAQSSFLSAYQENADALFRFAYFRTKNRERALDIVQETYLRTWRHVVHNGPIDEFRAFLFRTLRNLIIDFARQERVRNTQSLDAYLDAGGEVPDTKESAPYDSMDVEQAMRLLDALEPVTYRDAVQLRYIEGFSPKEIASILGVTENVASVRINRGIRKLQTLFQYEPK